MTTSSSTDTTDRVEAVEADDAETELVLADPEPAPLEIVPELVEEDDLVEGSAEDDGRAGIGALDASRGTSTGVLAGAAAVLAAGLALVSLSGNWLGSVLAQRQELLGQIATTNSSPANQQIKEKWLEPWHRTAFVSMGFAAAAIVVAAATLFLGTFAARQQAPVWVRAVAWGALLLGIVGVGVSAAMYFDVFTKAITVPAGG